MIFNTGNRYSFENYVYEILDEYEPHSIVQLDDIIEEMKSYIQSAAKDYVEELEDKELRKELSCYFEEGRH